MPPHHPHRTAFAHPSRVASHLGIEPGMAVADFGSGSGAYLWPIAEALQGSGKIFAIDVQQELLRRIANEARSRGFNTVKIIWADLERPRSSKIADGALDLVLISNMLFQIERKAAVLEEARRILRPRGRLALVDWQDSSPFGPHRKHAVSKEAGAALLRGNGFEPVCDFPAGTHHWGVLARIVPI